MGGKRVPRRSRRMKSVPSRAVRAGQWKPGIEPGSNRGPGCPGLCGRQGTGVPGSVRLTKGLPMGGAVKSGLGKRIGIVTDSDSCPTLCCLVLTGEQQDRKGNGYGHCGQQIPTALDYIFCHQTHVIPPPAPFRFSVLGGGGITTRN